MFLTLLGWLLVVSSIRDISAAHLSAAIEGLAKGAARTRGP
jgi:hypothetical protein